MGFLDFFNRLGGVRSPKWPEVQRKYLIVHPTCEMCGTKGGMMNKLNVHHIKPYHLFPEFELDEQNLITLCREHHLFAGHLNNFSSYNVTIREDANYWLTKIQQRP